jgi:hypothetical protein
MTKCKTTNNGIVIVADRIPGGSGFRLTIAVGLSRRALNLLPKGRGGKVGRDELRAVGLIPSAAEIQ